MVLKEPKKYRQVIWLTPEQNQVLQDFVRNLEHEWPINSTISEIVYNALRDSDASARIKSALNRAGAIKKGTIKRHPFQCRYCDHIDVSSSLLKIHESRYCKAHPLELVVSN